MPMIREPRDIDLPKVDWGKMAEEARKHAIKICKVTEEAHKKASKSKLVFTN